jgi:MYXO-CTERM domain-containing protein
MVKIALTLAFLSLPSMAYAGFCDGKMNGLWCNGDDLVNCSNGSTTSSQKCDCGCKSMPLGTADKCESCGSGFCSGKMNGLWCNGDDLVNCSNGSTTSSQDCDCGCESMPLGVNDQCKGCGDPFCNGKASGLWCKGDDLVNCSNGSITSSQHCDHGCVSMPAGTNDKCGDEPKPTGFCSDKANGLWCKGDDLVDCQYGEIQSKNGCQYGCISMPSGQSDQCGEPPQPTGFCSDKSNGDWCDGDDLVQCSSGETKSKTGCEFGCISNPPGQSDQCGKPPEPTGFCSGKVDGKWCDGDLLVSCISGNPAGESNCEFGCEQKPAGFDDACFPGPPDIPDPPDPQDKTITVTKLGQCGYFNGTLDLWAGSGLPVFNQLDHPAETLGTCNGLSLATSGCTITVLAMLYEYLGVERSVNGQSGNGPVIENNWRSQQEGNHTVGYAGTTYTAGGQEQHGECLVIWGKNPAGVTLHHRYNSGVNCIEYNAALAIAESLNNSMPIVAGVHWTGVVEDQHWVLVVGADADGLLLNDPYGGLSGARLDDNNLGAYVVDTFYTSHLTGGVGSPDEHGGVYDENGEPVDESTLDSTVPILDASKAVGPFEEPVSDEVVTSGCGVSSSPQGLWMLVLLALVGLLAVCRNRLRNC